MYLHRCIWGTELSIKSQKLELVFFVFWPFLRPVMPMEYMGEEYFKMKASVIKYERFVLKVGSELHCLLMALNGGALYLGVGFLCPHQTPTQGNRVALLELCAASSPCYNFSSSLSISGCWGWKRIRSWFRRPGKSGKNTLKFLPSPFPLQELHEWLFEDQRLCSVCPRHYRMCVCFPLSQTLEGRPPFPLLVCTLSSQYFLLPLQIPLPQKPPWWTVSNVCFEDIEVCHFLLEIILISSFPPPKAISLEILALYKRPRVFLLDLEKKLNLIKEEYSKKQIEIREVNLKKKFSDGEGGIF